MRMIAIAATAFLLASPVAAQDEEPNYQNVNRFEEGVRETARCAAHCTAVIRDGNALLRDLHRANTADIREWIVASGGEADEDAALWADQLEYCATYQDNARAANTCLDSCYYTAGNAYGLVEDARNHLIGPAQIFYTISVARGLEAGLWTIDYNDAPSGEAFSSACSTFWGEASAAPGTNSTSLSRGLYPLPASGSADYLQSLNMDRIEREGRFLTDSN